MLPHTWTSLNCDFRISPTRVVAVVFPLVPVIAQSSPLFITSPSSISLHISIPSLCINFTKSLSNDMPGLIMQSETPTRFASFREPDTYSIYSYPTYLDFNSEKSAEHASEKPGKIRPESSASRQSNM